MRRLVGFFLQGPCSRPPRPRAGPAASRRICLAPAWPPTRRASARPSTIFLDCSGWHLKRDIKTEIALTASWKMSLASKLDGQEPKSGNAFRFSTVQVQNGSEREIKGRVQRQAGELKAEIVQPAPPPNQFVPPPPTLMPVAAVDHLIERLRANAASFPALMFDAEVMGDAFLIDVTEQQRSQLRAGRPADKPETAPKGKSWPVFMTSRAAASRTRGPCSASPPRLRQRRAGPADRRHRPGHRHRRPAGPRDARSRAARGWGAPPSGAPQP